MLRKKFRFRNAPRDKEICGQLKSLESLLSVEVSPDACLFKMRKIGDILTVKYMKKFHLEMVKFQSTNAERLKVLEKSGKVPQKVTKVLWQILREGNKGVHEEQAGMDREAKERKAVERLVNDLDQVVLPHYGQVVCGQKVWQTRKNQLRSGFYGKLLQLDEDNLNALSSCLTFFGNGIYMFSKRLGLVNTVLAMLCCSWTLYLVYAHKVQLLREIEEGDLSAWDKSRLRSGLGDHSQITLFLVFMAVNITYLWFGFFMK